MGKDEQETKFSLALERVKDTARHMDKNVNFEDMEDWLSELKANVRDAHDAWWEWKKETK